MQDTMARLRDIIREVFDADDAEVVRETTADDVDGWDSLSHVNLIVTVEARFGIRFDGREVLSFANVGELADCVDRKLAAK